MKETHLPPGLTSIRYKQGQEYAYDSPRRGKARGGDWAVQAARGIIADLSDRRDIKRGFECVDADVRKEIVTSLAAIIRFAHERARG